MEQGGRTDAGARILEPLFDLVQGYGQTGQLSILLGIFAVLMAIRSIVLVKRDGAINRLQLEFVEAIRTRLVRRLAAAGWQNVARIKQARVVQALSVEMHQIGIAANSSLLASVALVMLIGHCALALLLAPSAGSLALVFAFLSALLSRPFLRRARLLGKAITEAHFGMTDRAILFLGGLKLATAQGLQDNFVTEYRAVSSAAMRDRLLFMRLEADLRNVTAILAAVVGAVTLFIGVAVFHLAPAVLITLILILSRMSAPAMIIQQGAKQILHSLPAYDVILSLENDLAGATSPDPPVVAEAPNASPERPVIFSNVTFRHPSGDRHAALENMSLIIPAGSFVGLVGPSGAGKTTFLDLVTGILPPQSGTIHVHGRELKGRGLIEHRAHLAYVAQDSFLFDDTVRHNLSWSRPDASDAEMWAAIEFVGAGNLLRRAGQGLDTPIGERGFLISAGERQRLALARAILRQPTFLALDEATNAIDVASERPILQRLASLSPRTTIFMVAHRTESLCMCDHILEFPGLSLLYTTKPSDRAFRPTPLEWRPASRQALE